MFVCNLILPLLMAVPLGQETANVRTRITLFEVPSMIVSRMITSRVTKDGGVEGTMMVGGDTTASFPAEGVSLPSRLPASSVSEDIKKVIREFMANSCLRAQDISVNELAGHELVFDHRCLAGQEVYQELHKGRPYPLSYRLVIEPAWQNNEEAGLHLQIWLRWQDPYGIQDIRDIIPERLAFDQTVAIKFGQRTLFGFPSSTSRSRRSIYWLALSVEKLFR